MDAKRLQKEKTNLEIEISRLLEAFNTRCVANHFQLQDIKLTTIGTDSDRIFEVDISIQ